MKTVLFLGGSRHQTPPIQYAKEKGYRTICCDYTPNAPAFELSNNHYQVSTTDMDAILDISKREKIDGIVAYASDPAAPTAAYVAEQLGLAGNPYESVNILARKDMYRDFLHKHNFNAPRVLDSFEFPMVVKPVDSSGSKGVKVVREYGSAYGAIEKAQQLSRCGKIILEEHIKRDGYQIAGDGFVIDGNLVFCGFAQEHFAPYGGIVPVGESFPYQGDTEAIKSEIQRLISLLGIRNGALNFDIVISQGKIYLMEIGPRNGGCLIPQVIKYQSGVDLIAATVESALGHKVILSVPEHKGYYSSCMIHSSKSGIYTGLEIDDCIQIVEGCLWVSDGETVLEYENSSCTLGHAILKWDSHLDMVEKMNRIEDYIKVCLK